MLDTMNCTNQTTLSTSLINSGAVEVKGLGYFDDIIPEIVGRLPVSGLQWARIMLPRMSIINRISLSGKSQSQAVVSEKKLV